MSRGVGDTKDALDGLLVEVRARGYGGLAPRQVAARHRAAPDRGGERIIALVRDDAGGELPGPVAPCCELALAAAQPGTYHVARVVQGGAFIQFYPAGDAGPAVAYPVTDPAALRRIFDELAGA